MKIVVSIRVFTSWYIGKGKRQSDKMGVWKVMVCELRDSQEGGKEEARAYFELGNDLLIGLRLR